MAECAYFWRAWLEQTVRCILTVSKIWFDGKRARSARTRTATPEPHAAKHAKHTHFAAPVRAESWIGDALGCPHMWIWHFALHVGAPLHIARTHVFVAKQCQRSVRPA